MINMLPTLGLVGYLEAATRCSRPLSIGDINRRELLRHHAHLAACGMVGRAARADPALRLSAAGRINEVLATDRRGRESPDARPLPAGPGELRLQGVTSVRPRRPVLGISIS